MDHAPEPINLEHISTVQHISTTQQISTKERKHGRNN